MNQLVAYRSSRVTADTAEALRSLERAGHEAGGVRIHYSGVPHSLFSWAGVAEDAGPTGLGAAHSMRPTGREVYLRAELVDYAGPEESRKLAELAAMWALAVPLGFVPYSRYPVPGDTDSVYHFLGPWAPLGDFLQGEGRGDLVWPSLCSAAQCVLGVWEGQRISERSVQSHLHRLGIHCGPVDGLIGDRTLASLRALGLGGLSMHDTLSNLRTLETPEIQPAKQDRRMGHFSMEGALPEAFTSGHVNTIKTQAGLSVTVDGPGRLILLFGEHE